MNRDKFITITEKLFAAWLQIDKEDIEWAVGRINAGEYPGILSAAIRVDDKVSLSMETDKFTNLLVSLARS
jgi:hypothetical protein